MNVMCHSPQDDGSFSLLTDEWGAIEEVLLLDAVEQEGLGNWLVMSQSGGGLTPGLSAHVVRCMQGGCGTPCDHKVHEGDQRLLRSNVCEQCHR